MNHRLRLTTAGVGLLLVTALLAGCGSITFGSSGEIFGQGHISRQIIGKSNDTIKSDGFRVEEGQTIVVNYAAKGTTGSMNIYVRQAWLGGERVYTIDVYISGNGQVRVPVAKPGNHRIIISLWGYSGDFDVSWKVG